jgi:carbamoylphosphate synthase large subunit
VRLEQGALAEAEAARAAVLKEGEQIESGCCLALSTAGRNVQVVTTAAMLDRLGLRATQGGTATNEDEAVAVAEKVGYPVLVRPSFVLGGRAMEIVYTPEDLRRYMRHAVKASPDRPVLVDRFLEDATEVDVDCLSDGNETVIGGVMEHIEEAGVHSGDSACVIPSFSLSVDVLAQLRSAAKAMAKELKVCGLMNVQFAVKDEEVYVLEVNPRASRTVPYVSKAIGVPLALVAAKLMAGKTLAELGLTEEILPPHYAVKEAVFPFIKCPGVDITLGPEMRSTGEVMGLDWRREGEGPGRAEAHVAQPSSGERSLPLYQGVHGAVLPGVRTHVARADGSSSAASAGLTTRHVQRSLPSNV